MSNIVLANEYTKLPVAAKGWITPKKPQPKGHKRQVKGPVKVRRNDRSVVTFDSPEDMVKAMKAEAKRITDASRYPDQESFENAEKQTGKPIWSYKLIQQVCKLNPDLFVEDSILVPGCAAFYKTVDGKKVPTGASFRKGLIPEFTVFAPEAEFDSIKITYGWRTVVMRLVKGLNLTYPDVLKIWGEVHYNDARGKHWNLNIREFRT